MLNFHLNTFLLLREVEKNTRQLKEQLNSISGPGSSGSISIKTETWDSGDGVINKTQKAESWGGIWKAVWIFHICAFISVIQVDFYHIFYKLKHNFSRNIYASA